MANELNAQEIRVLDYIEKYGSITLRQAVLHIGVMSLSRRITSLKRKGYPIVGKMIKVKNRYQETCWVKKYYLEERNEEH